MYDIYKNEQDDQLRFALGKEGKRKLLIIGLNPSTATKEKSDTTVAKVTEVAKRQGFDGFIMLNLYPVRATDYNELPLQADVEAFIQNIEFIVSLIADEPDTVIWAAWGESILARPFFIEACLELFLKLAKYPVQWLHYGELTASKHPRHPSRLSYSWAFSSFDTEQYQQRLNSQASFP